MKSIHKQLHELQKAYSRGLMTKYEFYLRHFDLKQSQWRQRQSGSKHARDSFLHAVPGH